MMESFLSPVNLLTKTISGNEVTLHLAGANGKVRLPAEDGEDVEENLEETLVRPQRRGAALLQVAGG